MQSKSAITPEMESIIGKTETYSSPEEIGRATIRKFALAVGDLNPIYWDEKAAQKSRYKEIIAPPTMIFELTHNLADEISKEDGGYMDKVTLPAPFTRIVRGGNEYEFLQPVRPTDKVTVSRKVTKVHEKVGKSGPIIFVDVVLEYANQHGDLLGINKETYLFLSDVAA